jgi:uncharacterized protein (TIGR01732 family)
MYSNVNAPPTVAGFNVGPQPSCYYTAPAYAYCAPVNRCNDFVLIVVLFILLIIVGAAYICC